MGGLKTMFINGIKAISAIAVVAGVAWAIYKWYTRQVEVLQSDWYNHTDIQHKRRLL